MDAINKIIIDVSDPLTTPVVKAVQEDSRSRFVEITLIANGEPLAIPAVAHGMIGIRRPNGTYVLYDADEDNNPAVTFDGNVATAYLSQEALAIAGDLYTSVSVYTSNQRLTAFHFIVSVEQTAVPSDVVVDSDYFNILESMIEDAVDAANRAEQAAAQVGDPVSYTAQTKTDAQKAQARANIGAMALDATPTPAAHASTHALGGSDALSPADIGAIRVYKSVTELGLTEGSATIAGIWTAMSDKSLLMVNASQLASAERPPSGTLGDIEIFRFGNSLGRILSYGKLTSSADYRMFLNSNNVPDGTWVRIGGKTTGDFVRNGNWTTAANNAIKFLRVGSVVTMYGSIYPTFQVPAYTSFGTIPPGFRPTDDISMLFIPSAQTANPYWIYAGSDGSCSTQSLPLPPNERYYVTATYIAK